MKDQMPKATRSHRPKPRNGFDGAGHMDPAHARRLLELARANKDSSDDSEAFLSDDSEEDDLSEELGEAMVATMTTGEDQFKPMVEAEVDEERGGPFLVTSAAEEFAEGTDESNIPEATREPFPTT